MILNLAMKTTRSFLSIGLLALPSLLWQHAEGATFHRNSVSTSLLSNARSNLFGVPKLSKIPRGGAEEAIEESEPQSLYLPGLLDAELTKSSQVRRTQEILPTFGLDRVTNKALVTANCFFRF